MFTRHAHETCSLTCSLALQWLYSGAGKTDASVEATSAVVKKRQKTNERSVNVFKDAKKFSQIILDYFWIPDSWAGNHWR